MVSLTFTSFDNYAFSMIWSCTCFASSDDFFVYIMTSRSDCDLLHFTSYPGFQVRTSDVQVQATTCYISHLMQRSKRGHPRVASFSVASFSALHSSVRYLISLYTLLATVHFVVSRRCMMQPIIFLLLIVVRLT